MYRKQKPCIFNYKSQQEKPCWFIEIPKRSRFLFDEKRSFFEGELTVGLLVSGHPCNIKSLKLPTSLPPQIKSPIINFDNNCHNTYLVKPTAVFLNSVPCFSGVQNCRFQIQKTDASARIPKKRQPRSSKLSKSGKRWKRPTKIQQVVHALDAARYPYHRSQNFFLSVSVKKK